MRPTPLLWAATGILAAAAAAAIPFMLRDTQGPGGMPRAMAYQPLPARAAVLTRIAFGSGAAQDRPQPVLDAVRRQSPQLFIYMGDNVHGGVDRENSSPDLPELRHAYGRLSRRAEFRRLVRSVPVLAIWDDHDYGSSHAGADFPFRRQSERLFRAFWAIGNEDPRAGREGLYHARIFGPPGRRVQIVLLDTRSFRSPLKRTENWKNTGRPGYVPDPDPAKTMLGEDQWRWLERQLLKPAELRLIVSSVQVIAEGHRFEKWANLPLERQRLFDLIALTGAEGVVLLSGGRHAGGFYEYAEGTPYPFYEITSGSLNRPIPGLTEPGPHRLGSLYGEINFGMLDVDWDARQFTLALHNGRGRPVDGHMLTLAFGSLETGGVRR
ncbi:MAG: alkaline phosphatase D family protein [Alphaproteobacteria bacterium]